MTLPYVADRRLLEAATALVEAHGPAAGLEAARRAGESRDLGNAVTFCRWRQIERLIVYLAPAEAIGTVH